ncbi:hypothetical protein, partial [Nostoc sp.]|uniref:hypothetical protein n=1 Tax=Nostoc sp. TaxID=1180 RepID=UPI002FF4CFD9
MRLKLLVVQLTILWLKPEDCCFQNRVININLLKILVFKPLDLLQKSQIRGTSRLELGSIDDLRTSKKLKA